MNVLIVDDDVYVVEALRRSVPWGSIGIGKVYYAYSVERAKKLLKSGSVKVGCRFFATRILVQSVVLRFFFTNPPSHSMSRRPVP